MSLLELADKIETAEASEQFSLLSDAFDADAGAREFGLSLDGQEFSDWYDQRAKFYKLLDAGAYESAAISMVPEGYDFEIARLNGGLTIHAKCGSNFIRFGNTPALALCAAILSARAGAAK